MTPSFAVMLTGKEFRVVALALARKLDTQADIAEAARLNIHLTGLRHQQLKQACGVSAAAFRQAVELGQEIQVEISDGALKAFSEMEKGKNEKDQTQNHVP